MMERFLERVAISKYHDNFILKSIKPIHDTGEYEDFRLGIEATFFTIKVNMKLDITTGDMTIPREVDYSFKLMFENRNIQVKAYNLNKN